jgi:GntR family transcriptional regulator, transcriptional repressor for pyruvate dehydrogenase complex
MSEAGDTASMELTALTLLAAASQPVGSARLAEALRQAGLAVAEATAGRYLRQLDARGLTRSLGAKRGRTITDAGRARLADLQRLRRHDAYGANLLRAVATTELDELMDLLYVRRAVETEAARLAASRATDAELAQIAAASRAHVHDVRGGHDTVEPSLNLHRLVAEASHNRLLIAVALLLLDPAHDPLEKMLGQIALHTGETLDQATDHLLVAKALRSRDPAAAEAAMRAHLDKLIHAVAAYRRATAPG